MPCKAKPCGQCGAIFKPHRRTQTYCSRECHSVSLPKSDTSGICCICDKPFRRWRKEQSTCSQQCAGKARRGSRAYNYKGGCISSEGYKVIRVEGRAVYEHRHAMELHIGRPLGPNEVVHHKDGDRLNNAIENLELMDGRAMHALTHTSTFRDADNKECSRCRQTKSRTEFRRNKRPGQDSHKSWCKECDAAYDAERWRKGLTSQQR
jgi:hypothetical protein